MDCRSQDADERSEQFHVPRGRGLRTTSERITDRQLVVMVASALLTLWKSAAMASFSVFSTATAERQRQSLRDRVGWLRPAAAAY